MTEHADPEPARHDVDESDETPFTEITESDPNADSEVGLAGEMGVSSERRGPVRGQDEPVTHATAPTYVEQDEDAPTPPEQSASSGHPEVQPD